MNTSTWTATGIVGLLVFVFQLWVFLKALKFPASAWQDAHVSRTLWLVLLVASFFVSACGLAITVIFWFGPMTKLNRQAQVGHIGFPGR